MSKVKWSFSLLFAIFIVGILNTAAFASDLYSLKAVPTDSGLVVSFNGNTNDAADKLGTEFDLVLMNGSTVLNTYGHIPLDINKNGTYTIPSLDVKPGKSYKIQLYHTADTGHVTLLSGIVVADANGTGLLNSNETGLNTRNKSRSGQNVHGFYQNNTNSCASCHQTHTANDNNLLFKDGVYSTCSACHDGTTGAFNNFTPTSGSTSDSISGTFDVSADLAHGSLHQADGTFKISTAPGGNNTPDKTPGSIGASTWGQDFECSSCHAPHGGGTDEENNLNIDPLGWGGIAYADSGDAKNGKLFNSVEIVDLTVNGATLPQTMSTPYILVKRTLTDADNVSATNNKTAGYLYGRAGAKTGDLILQTYRWSGPVVLNGDGSIQSGGYVPDYSLWLRSTGHVSAPFANANTLFKDGTGADITNTLNVVWRDGFIYGSAVSNVASANISIGIDVETTGDIKSLYDPTSASYIFDSGVEMTKYCAACHTNYMTDPTTGVQGVQASLTQPYRHTGVTDQMTCVRCHFAHGTKASIMKDKTDQLSATTDTLSDTNHSSATRRYIDLDSCYVSGCHATSEDLLKALE